MCCLPFDTCSVLSLLLSKGFFRFREEGQQPRQGLTTDDDVGQYFIPIQAF